MTNTEYTVLAFNTAEEKAVKDLAKFKLDENGNIIMSESMLLFLLKDSFFSGIEFSNKVEG